MPFVQAARGRGVVLLLQLGPRHDAAGGRRRQQRPPLAWPRPAQGRDAVVGTCESMTRRGQGADDTSGRVYGAWWRETFVRGARRVAPRVL